MSRFAAATDAELVRAAVAGDRAAMTAVWDRYASASRSCLRARMGSSEDVEDLLQDVFVAFLTSVHRIRRHDSLRAYLLAIAATLVASAARRRVKRLVSLSPTGEIPDVPSPPPDFEGREALLELQRKLERMPPRVGLGYGLHHISGFELTDVARTLGVSCSTAKRAVARARKRLVSMDRLAGA